MDEGWTRFVLDTFSIPNYRITNEQMRSGKFECGNGLCDSVILPSDGEASVLRGLPASRYPEELAGGIGDEGVRSLKKFVEDGGRVVCFDRGCDLVIGKFELPVREALSGLKRSEFYDPGSIVRIEVDRGEGVPEEVPAYFASSSAYDVLPDAKNVRVTARYAAANALLSGWMLGEEFLNGKAAIVEARYGKGSIVMFGFRPQHRGQSWATFSLIFDALEK